MVYNAAPSVDFAYIKFINFRVGLCHGSASTLRVVSDQLDSLYNVAGIELAVDDSANWAGLLSSDDLPRLEYATDLKVCSYCVCDNDRS